MRVFLVWLVMVLYSGVSFSEEAMVVLRSTVKGNQEQPRVMYIVPWHRPGDSSLEYQPMDTLVDDLFTPVDRDEFTRELEYRDMLSAPASLPD
jgi:hypothetical protein